MKITQLVPRSETSQCGVSDYAKIVGKKIKETHTCDVIFGAANADGEGDSLKQDYPARSIQSQLDGAIVIFHYVGYGYQKRGCPFWLPSALKRWRKKYSNGRLVTMFHELYAFGKPWQSSFWTSPLQRWICREIARLSDEIVTNREESAAVLQRMSGGRAVKSLPVFSNVGEPGEVPEFGARQNWLALFGSSGWRHTALTRDRLELERACRRAGIEKIIEIGGGHHGAEYGELPVKRLGRLEADDVSHWLRQCRYGFISYPSDYLEKSGIFAAYAAHGVVPVLADLMLKSGTQGVTAGEHFLTASALTGEDAPIGHAIHAWYQGHRSEAHARHFAASLNI